MTRQPQRRMSATEMLSRLHRGFRAKLTPDQRSQLELCHLVNLDAIATGAAEPAILWDWVGCVLTWMSVAEQLRVGELEMTLQIEVATRLVDRFGRTGQVRFDGPDYQAARVGLQIMSQLADIVDAPTAVLAVSWSERELDKIQISAMAFRPMAEAA